MKIDTKNKDTYTFAVVKDNKIPSLLLGKRKKQS